MMWTLWTLALVFGFGAGVVVGLCIADDLREWMNRRDQ